MESGALQEGLCNEGPSNQLRARGLLTPILGPSLRESMPHLDMHKNLLSQARDPFFIVPLEIVPNEVSVGMDKEAKILHERLYEPNRRRKSVAVVLTQGGPGSGKNREYIWSQRHCYRRDVFWVDAESRESMNKAYWDIAQPHHLISIVRMWLEDR